MDRGGYPSSPGWGHTLGYPPPQSRPGMGHPPPPVKVWTDTQSENITFPHPSDAGGKKRKVFVAKLYPINMGEAHPCVKEAINEKKKKILREFSQETSTA